MTTTAPLGWGILGTGGIAGAFAKDLSALPDARLVAVGSRDLGRAQAFVDALPAETTPAPTPHADPVRAHGSQAALLADPAVDIVYIATPHPQHAEGALAAIAAGKHVLVEKPFTMNADQARTVVAAARAAGVFCLEAMWTRFLPHTIAVRALLADGAVGRVTMVVADHGQHFDPDPTHRLFDPALGGGALLDLGVYPVSWAVMVLGAPREIVATSTPAMTGVDAQTTAVLHYDGGTQALVTCTLESFTPCRAWISGDAGSIDVDPVFYAPTTFTHRRNDGRTERFEAGTELSPGPGKGLRFEAAEAVRCVRAGLLESPAMPLDETVTVMSVMDEIRRQIGLVYPGVDD